jgi:phage tail tape-measure protein
MATTPLNVDIKVKGQGALGSVNGQLRSMQTTGLKLTSILKGAGVALLAMGAVRLVGSIINTVRTFEDLKATLVTIEGDAIKAGEAFELIRKFTAGTTFQLEEVSNAFVTFRNAGLAPTQDMMTEIGNIAAGMGKRFDEVAKAVFNATTGEFEMLKQLGIKVKVQGDNLTAIFRGTSTKLGNNTDEILGYIRSIGKEKFAGAIEARAETLTGAFSNFSDALAETAMELGEGGLKTELTEAARGMTVFITENKEAITTVGKFVGVTLGLLIDALGIVAKAIFKVLHVLGVVTEAIVDFGKSIMKYIPFIDKQSSAMNDNVVAMRNMHEAYKVTVGATEEASVSIEENAEVVKKATKSYAFYEDGIIRIKDATKRAEKQQRAFEESIADDVILQALKRTIGEGMTPLEGKITAVAAGMQAFQSTASSALTDVVMGVKSLKDALGEIVNATLKAMIQGFINLGVVIFILEPLERKLRDIKNRQRGINSELKTEIGLRTILAFLTGGASLGFGGFKAGGGPVSANTPYMVGERGPEMFVPNSSGSIISNSDMGDMGDGSAVGGGGGGDNIEVTFNINTIDATDFDQLLTTRQDLIVGLINRSLAERGKRSLLA